MKFLTNIDFGKNEIQNAVVQVLASAPASGQIGQIYYNSTDKKLYQHDGTSWKVVGVTYTHAFGTVTSNSVPLTITGSDGSTSTVNITGAGGATISVSGDTLTITTSDTTYGSGTQSDLETGTSTTDKVWQAKILHDYVAAVVGGANAMRFKGTIGSTGDIQTLPTTGVQVGDTYMVVEAGTYASQVCEIGDLIIATATTPTWTVAQTNIDGAITSISGTAPISVTGSGNSRTVAISNATDSADGAMSSTDKAKLDSITATKTGTATITAGQTSVNVAIADALAWKAIDASTGEQVLINYTKNVSNVTFSISAAYTNNIDITYIAAA